MDMDMDMDMAAQSRAEQHRRGSNRLQRSYASDYLGLGILITGYILVRLPLSPSLPLSLSNQTKPTESPN
jgi:hypothetical protein